MAKHDPQAARPRVMFLLTHSAAGGAPEIWSNLAEGFARRGYPVRLAALYPPEDEAPQPAAGEHDWLYVRARKPGNPLGGVGLFRDLVGFLRRHAPDVIFTALPAADLLVPLAAQFLPARTRVVVSHHSPVDTYAAPLRAAEALTGRLPRVSAIVSVSEAVGRSLDGRSPAYRARTRVIHNSLPPAIEHHLETLAARRRDRPERRELVAVGRLAAQKNCDILLLALARVRDASLTFVGTGPDEPKLRAMVTELGLDGRVRFLGQRTRTEALDLLADSDVFLQPSLFEGHSLALIEASKIGIPLVVSDVPSQVEGVTGPDGNRCGIVVGARDEVALAAEIQRLLDDPAYRRDWTERARRLGESVRFEKTVAAYEALVPAEGRGR
ncbi:glycosyltransferase [Amaricoccus solimangrovi]|uniref:glycosyltransferase n=1 Tax=Amaricoccus solimangrovi TaxID=2589815 RepID=UPI0015E37706|nr:glycosyltransferase [Amaricoccus solimangrovi]